MEYTQQDQDRGVYITLVDTIYTWWYHTINIIVTSSLVNLNLEVNDSLCILDGYIIVFYGVASVKLQRKTIYH